MLRTSLPEQATGCLHPEIEAAMHAWMQTRTQPAFLLMGPPGVGKTTMVYRVCKEAKYWTQEFNASHTRTGTSFRQTILPLLTDQGISALVHPSTPNGRAVLLDEMDGLSQGEKGGLQELLDYLKSKRNFKQDAPLFLICNTLEGRVMQQLLKFCYVQEVGMPNRVTLNEFYGLSISDNLYRLGDLRKVQQSLVCTEAEEAYTHANNSESDTTIHVALRAAWYTLFEHWGENDELDLETKDANLAGLLFHQNLPLFLEKASPIGSTGTANPIGAECYDRIFEYIRWSDRADFWAFFHQCWSLLPLSYHLKLKYPNTLLQAYPKPTTIPGPSGLVYTQVLTKQSALFNSWKEMNRVSNELGVPFRCVGQWATYQTGKSGDMLGLPVKERLKAAAMSGVLSDLGVVLHGPDSAACRKKVPRKKTPSASSAVNSVHGGGSSH